MEPMSRQYAEDLAALVPPPVDPNEVDRTLIESIRWSTLEVPPGIVAFNPPHGENDDTPGTIRPGELITTELASR